MSDSGGVPSPTKPATRHLFLTGPRTASHLFIRILNLEGQDAHPTPKDGYFWLQAAYKRIEMYSKPICEWTPEERQAIENIEQQCFDNLLNYINSAERVKKKVMIKEHAILLNHPFFESQFIHGSDATVGEPQVLKGYPDDVSNSRSPLNMTILSDDFLKTFKPTFLIRHPAMSIPSLFRAVQHEGFKRSSKELNAIETSLFWPRKLLEFYEAHSQDEYDEPIVLDADDVMTSQALVLKYAKLAGLDPDKLCFSWEKASEEVTSSQSPFVQHMLGSLNSSDRVDLTKVAGDIDISGEAMKWKAEFGDELGRTLETHVRAAMADYEYMRSRRLKI